MNNFTNESQNEYDYDYDNEICEKDDVVGFASVVIPVFFSVVITLSLMGNLLVLVVLALYEDLRSIINIFIFNLAISDLVFTAGLPFWAIDHIWGWSFPESLCKIVTFIFFTGFYSSVLFLTIMTIYRYLSVVYPLCDLSSPKRSRGILLSVLMWIISIGAAMPSLLFSSIVRLHHKDRVSLGCEYNAAVWEQVSVIQQNIFFLLAFGLMAFCYIQILLRITRTRSRAKNRAVKMVFCIVAVFFVGWVPYNVVIFLRILEHFSQEILYSCETSIRLDYAFYVSRLIAYSHCCLNPVFYALVGVKFRSHLHSILQRLFRRKSPVMDQQVQMRNLVSKGSMY